MKSEISRLLKENERLGERLKSLGDEYKRQEYQLQRLIGKPMDNTDKREEGELWRENKIRELEAELKAA